MSTYVAVFALVLGYVALVVAYLALRTLAKLRRSTALLSRGVRGRAGRESLLEALDRQAELTASTREQLLELRTLIASTREEALAAAAAGTAEVSGVLRNVALVRYDAFDGMSGRMSFSLALLDETGEGVTISALAGPSDTRVYAKGVTAGKVPDGEHPLTPEERQAVTAALSKSDKSVRRAARKAS